MIFHVRLLEVQLSCRLLVLEAARGGGALAVVIAQKNKEGELSACCPFLALFLVPQSLSLSFMFSNGSQMAGGCGKRQPRSEEAFSKFGVAWTGLVVSEYKSGRRHLVGVGGSGDVTNQGRDAG